MWTIRHEHPTHLFPEVSATRVCDRLCDFPVGDPVGVGAFMLTCRIPSNSLQLRIFRVRAPTGRPRVVSSGRCPVCSPATACPAASTSLVLDGFTVTVICSANTYTRVRTAKPFTGLSLQPQMAELWGGWVTLKECSTRLWNSDSCGRQK